MNYKIIGGDQKEYGPVTPEQLRLWIADGRANGQTLVQPEGGAGWRELRTFPELAALLGTGVGPAAVSPGAVSMPAPLRPNIPNYLVLAIITTACCCMPLGIPAIVYASQVNGKIDAGDFAGAERASKNARMWGWLALGVGALVMLIYALVAAFVGHS